MNNLQLDHKVALTLKLKGLTMVDGKMLLAAKDYGDPKVVNVTTIFNPSTNLSLAISLVEDKLHSLHRTEAGFVAESQCGVEGYSTESFAVAICQMIINL